MRRVLVPVLALLLAAVPAFAQTPGAVVLPTRTGNTGAPVITSGPALAAAINVALAALAQKQDYPMPGAPYLSQATGGTVTGQTNFTGGLLIGGVPVGTTGKVALTQPATGSTLTILDGKTLRANNTLTLGGTDGTTMTFPATSGTVATLNATNSFSVRQFFPASISDGSSSGGAVDFSMGAAVGNNRVLRFQGGGFDKWQMGADNTLSTGLNSDSQFFLGSYTDAGVFDSFILRAARTSGPAGNGAGFITKLAPWSQGPGGDLAVLPKGSVGNLQTLTDALPPIPLAANPITTSFPGTPTVITIAIPNSVTTFGATSLFTETWVLLSGATAVGGITPNGTWLPVGFNRFTVSAASWSGGVVTMTTSAPHGISVGQSLVIEAMTPDGYNGTFTATAGTTGSTVKFALVANPGASTIQGTIVDPNTITATWTGSATSAATGGGSVVTATPMSAIDMNKSAYTVTSAAQGFNDGNLFIYTVEPQFYRPTAGGIGPAYQANWLAVNSPKDTSKAFSFGTNAWEVDLINRAGDEGYAPILSAIPRNTIGMWMGPTQPQGGADGTGYHWNTVNSCFSGQASNIGVYDCYSWQRNSLVPAESDTILGHGGVGIDGLGSYTGLGNPGLTSFAAGATTIGLNYTNAHETQLIVAGVTTVFVYGTRTFNGLTINQGEYLITALVGNVATIGPDAKLTGASTGAAVGGGAGIITSLSRLAPYAPTQMWGRYKHGYTTNDNFYSEDGLAFSTNPYNGFGFCDGTACANKAGMFSTETSVGNMSVDLTPVGTGLVNIKAPLNLKAFTVATLPACAAGTKGSMAYVTDAAATPVYNATLAGSGAVVLPVFCNGTNWTNH